MGMADIREELSSSFRTKKVTLNLPLGLGGIEFTRDEFLGLYDVHDHVADVLLKSFVEKYVMHYDLTKEEAAGTITSLNKVAEYLDQKLTELRGKLAKPQRGIIRLLDLYRNCCVEHAKTIYRRNEEIEEGNRGEFESDYKVRPSDWLPEPLREFRLAVYPLVRTLIDTLPDGDPVKAKALKVWYEGRKLLDEEQKDQALPQWRVERAQGAAEPGGC